MIVPVCSCSDNARCIGHKPASSLLVGSLRSHLTNSHRHTMHACVPMPHRWEPSNRHCMPGSIPQQYTGVSMNMWRDTVTRQALASTRAYARKLPVIAQAIKWLFGAAWTPSPRSSSAPPATSCKRQKCHSSHWQHLSPPAATRSL